MRIGELADLVGVSTRTIRHYHHVGVLPEPARAGNGYREYGLADAVRLVRARRLTELGLSLDEVADVLAGEQDRDLDEIMAEVETDLTRREAELRAQRERVVALRQRLIVQTGPPVDAVGTATADPGLTGYLDAVRSAGASGAALDHDAALLSLVGGPDAAELGGLLGSVGRDSAATARAARIYRRFDALADEPDPSAPEVADLAAAILATVPAELVSRARGGATAIDPAHRALLTEGLSAGQRGVVDAVLAAVSGEPTGVPTHDPTGDPGAVR